MDLVELKPFLPEPKKPGQFADVLKQLRCPPAAELVMALLWGTANQHHPVGTFLEGLQDRARADLSQAI
jgi:hypothetical protein